MMVKQMCNMHILGLGVELHMMELLLAEQAFLLTCVLKGWRVHTLNLGRGSSFNLFSPYPSSAPSQVSTIDWKDKRKSYSNIMNF